MSQEEYTMDRRRAPVFIVGSPRSGNNFLYHTLLSSGGFAIYRAASQVFNMLVPRFGDLSVLKNRQKMMKMWLASPYFERTGLDAQSIERKVLAECRNGGDFLRIVMGEMCAQQKVARWACVGVEEILYLPEIKRTLPDALFIHTIRDGRDVALSLGKKGFIRPFPWDKDRSMLVAALYWDWIVRKGREHGRTVGRDYLEIHYEDLVTSPRETLEKIGGFIEHDLDYDRIQQAAIGTVSQPNTSFGGGDEKGSGFNPVGRWKSGYSGEQLALVESLIGPLLQQLGYPLETQQKTGSALFFKLDQWLYRSFFGTKLWLKANTPLARFLVNIDTMVDEAAFRS
jgi:hypothetical protein